MDDGVGAAGNHDVRLVKRNNAGCIDDRLRAGGTGAYDAVVGTLEPVGDGDLSGGEDDQLRADKEW